MPAKLLLLLLLTAIVAGCAGEADEPVASFTAADAHRLAKMAPSSPDWDWPAKPSDTGVSDPDDEVPETADDPNVAALYAAIRDLEELGGASRKWTDDDKLANLNVSAWATASDAREATNAYRKFLHAWGDGDFGEVTKDEDVDGLWDEAWVSWIEGNGTQVTYEVRLGNLLVATHVHCYGSCPEDVDGAARAWAEAIETDARGP